MRCVDVAALFAAAILRRNPDSVVVPFDTAAYEAKVDPQDTILSLAERLAKYGGGGTDCSLPLVQANGKYAKRRFAGVRAGQRQRELGVPAVPSATARTAPRA
jgi:60 kDa SS-A/Ro ribonucleoprotein